MTSESLGERMEPALVMASATEVYQEQVAEHGARFARPGPAEVRMIVDPSVPPGRYRLRQGQPVNAGVPAEPAYPPASAHATAPMAFAAACRPSPAAVPAARPTGASWATTGRPRRTRTRTGRPATACRPSWNAPSPRSRCSASSPVTRSRRPGRPAPGPGAGPVELALPEVPTVSREHARFTFSDGQWRIANLGMNGLTVNGQPVAGEHPVNDGDAIRWGTRPDALASRVEIR